MSSTYLTLGAGFSLVGFLFLSSVVIVFSTSSIFYNAGIQDEAAVKANVWGAAALYGVTFTGCVVALRTKEDTAYDNYEDGGDIGMAPVKKRVYSRKDSGL